MTGDSRVGTAFGKYDLVALLGRGGMGEVYQAFDRGRNRTVALKILREEFAHDDTYRARFLRESQAAAVLQEPHVIPIHDWGEIDGYLYIDMRLVQGETLQDLAAAGPLDPARAIAIVAQVAAALDAAHAHGLIHRDIKPQNILVTPADFAYLVDFGIAETRGDARLTMDGSQIGSLAYMAPERFNDEPCTPAADIYSLACVLYETLTGETPYPANSYEYLIAAHLTAAPPHPHTANPRVPAALDDVIARGMAKEPDDRYGSAGAFARAADRALGASAAAAAAGANTLLRPQVSPIPVPVVSNPIPPRYTTAPTPAPEGGGQSRPLVVPLAVIGAAAALLLGAIGVVIGILVSRNNNQPPAAAPAAAPTIATPTVYQTVPVPATRAPTLSAPANAPTPRADPEVTSAQQLRQIAGGDRALVASTLADRWVPQLSSKRPGVVDQGVVWDNALTLQEHLRLRQEYDAKLVWSGDWSTFDAQNWWVTVVPLPYDDAAGALAWCSANGYDRDHCYAKMISATHPITGSSAFN